MKNIKYFIPAIIVAIIITIFSTILPAQGGFPKSNPSTLTGAFVQVHHSTGTTGVLLDSLNNAKVTGDNLGNHTATTNLAMAQFNINNTNKVTSDTVATTNITNLSKAESPTGGTAKSRIIMGTALSIPTSIRTENSSNANQYGQLAVDADGITSLIQVNGSQEAGLKIEADSIVNLYTSGNNSIGFVGDTAKVITNNITAIQVVPTGKVEIKDYLLAETTASPAQAEKFAILPVDCSGGAKTVTPPASPVAGDWFAVSDSRASAGANNITVDTSGDKLHGGANDYIMNANADYVRFTYVNATIGWIKSN